MGKNTICVSFFLFCCWVKFTKLKYVLSEIFNVTNGDNLIVNVFGNYKCTFKNYSTINVVSSDVICGDKYFKA